MKRLAAYVVSELTVGQVGMNGRGGYLRVAQKGPSIRQRRSTACRLARTLWARYRVLVMTILNLSKRLGRLGRALLAVPRVEASENSP